MFPSFQKHNLLGFLNFSVGQHKTTDKFYHSRWQIGNGFSLLKAGTQHCPRYILSIDQDLTAEYYLKTKKLYPGMRAKKMLTAQHTESRTAEKCNLKKLQGHGYWYWAVFSSALGEGYGTALPYCTQA